MKYAALVSVSFVELPHEHLKKLKIKRSCKGASNEEKKFRKQTIVTIENYYVLHFQRFQKYPQIHTTIKKFKKLKKAYKEASNEKCSENKL